MVGQKVSLPILGKVCPGNIDSGSVAEESSSDDCDCGVGGEESERRDCLLSLEGDETRLLG